MVDPILVAIDDSETANAALDHAVELGNVLGATVHVLTVVEPRGSQLTFGVEEVDDINRAAEGLLTDVSETYVGTDADLEAEVRRGQPTEQILDYADEVGADRIVVGQRGTGGLTGAIIGSTADRLARLATIPVTIVPNPDEANPR